MADEKPNADLASLTPEDRIAEQLAAIMKDKGTEGGLRVLYDDNLDVRRKNAKLRELVTEAREKLPKSDAVVLTGDDAKSWAAIQALQIPVTEIADRLKTGKGSEAEAAAEQMKQHEVHREAGALLKWNPTLLTELATDKKIPITVTDAETEDGTKVRVAVVLPSEDGKEAIPLDEYEPLKAYHPALRLADAAEEQPTKKSPATSPAPRMLPQKSGANGAIAAPDLKKLADEARATGAYPRL